MSSYATRGKRTPAKRLTRTPTPAKPSPVVTRHAKQGISGSGNGSGHANRTLRAVRTPTASSSFSSSPSSSSSASRRGGGARQKPLASRGVNVHVERSPVQAKNNAARGRNIGLAQADSLYKQQQQQQQQQQQREEGDPMSESWGVVVQGREMDAEQYTHAQHQEQEQVVEEGQEGQEWEDGVQDTRFAPVDAWQINSEATNAPEAREEEGGDDALNDSDVLLQQFLLYERELKAELGQEADAELISEEDEDAKDDFHQVLVHRHARSPSASPVKRRSNEVYSPEAYSGRDGTTQSQFLSLNSSLDTTNTSVGSVNTSSGNLDISSFMDAELEFTTARHAERQNRLGEVLEESRVAVDACIAEARRVACDEVIPESLSRFRRNIKERHQERELNAFFVPLDMLQQQQLEQCRNNPNRFERVPASLNNMLEEYNRQQQRNHRV